MSWVLWVVNYRRSELHHNAKDLMPSTGCRMEMGSSQTRPNPLALDSDQAQRMLFESSK